ncbi:MAG: CheR family methyltransferase [Halanaerobiales bacterium]
MSLTFDQFTDQASEILNIKLSGYKIKRVKRRTDSIMRRYEVADYDECIYLLKNNLEFKEAYLDHFTINTSEFYRNPQNFKYLEKKIFPELFEQNKQINIWSAPCSNGSEPYTLALMLAELKYRDNQYKILASDLDVNILEEAKNAIYNPNSVQNVPEDVLDKYFLRISQTPVRYKLDTKIKQKINFEQKDLINEPFKKGWDLILSRNFFIYLTSDIKDMLTHKFTEALNPGGYLFLGNTEFIFTPTKYGLQKVYSSFYKKI